MNLLAPFRENRRLRVGVALIAWIFGVNALIDWNDHLASQLADYRRSLAHLARLMPGQPLEVWARRATDGVQALTDARGLLWRNASAGLAQAQVQDWLNDALRRTAAQGASVRVGEPDAAAPRPAAAASAHLGSDAPVPMRARIEFNTDPAVMLAMLEALNNAEHRIGVDALRVKPGKTEISLTFWFALATPASAPAARPGR
jgi:hypothetical protein